MSSYVSYFFLDDLFFKFSKNLNISEKTKFKKKIFSSFVCERDNYDATLVFWILKLFVPDGINLHLTRILDSNLKILIEICIAYFVKKYRNIKYHIGKLSAWAMNFSFWVTHTFFYNFFRMTKMKKIIKNYKKFEKIINL